MVTFGEPLGHVIPLRGPFVRSRTGDDLLPPPTRVSIPNASMCTFKTFPCVPAPRAHVFIHVDLLLVHTGTFLNAHTEACRNPHTGFSTFFSAYRTTHTAHTKHIARPTTTPHHTTCTPTHNTTQHNITHNITRRQRQREKTEKE